jgi:deazaflavin-dependent oxidoreductase (nitroreductase family)
MPAAKDSLKERLARYRELTISVTGRKSGRTISLPVWFVLEGDTLYLLPVHGSDTQWYKNILQNPEMGIAARDKKGKFHATLVNDRKTVESVVEKFREKYTATDVKKYYSKFDVAVTIQLD